MEKKILNQKFNIFAFPNENKNSLLKKGETYKIYLSGKTIKLKNI